MSTSEQLGKYVTGATENMETAVCLYGVAPGKGAREVVCLYGVRPPVTPITPPTIHDPSIDIDISYSELESNISILKGAVKTIQSNWDGVMKNNINKLSNSWAGDDCSAYIEKVKKMDTQVSNSVEALNLLIDTYQKAKDEIASQQNKITSKITNID